jgi:hypothetical protein
MLALLSSSQSIALLGGLLLVAVGLVGGGIEVKEIKVPPLPMVPRAASFVIGCLLLSLVFLDPGVFNPPAPAPSSEKPAPGKTVLDKPAPDKPKELGAAIKYGLIQVSEVKRVLQHLGMYQGPLNNDDTPAYREAVAEFQRSQNIPQDTLVGGDTFPKLQQAWPEFFSKPKS